jgi:hypothetical protein
LKNVRALYECVLLLVEFQLVYKRLGPDSSSVDRPFNLKGGLWFFVSFKNIFSDNTRVRIFIFFVAQRAKFFSRI